MTKALPFRFELRRRGYYHRVSSDDRGRLDEVVLRIGRESVPPKKIAGGKIVANPKADSRSGIVLHLEMMSDRAVFADVAGVCFWIWIQDGVARISGSEDRRPGRGLRSYPWMRDPKLDEPKRKKRGR